MDPHSIARQLRSFLVSHLHSDMAGSLTYDFSDSGLEQYSSCTPAEEQYYLWTLGIIHKLVTKNIPLSDIEDWWVVKKLTSCSELTSPNYFCIPMIREGILDTINDMYSCWTKDKLLPSFKYIQSKIDFPEAVEQDDNEQSQEDQFSMGIQTPKEQITDMILKIKDTLEATDYQGDNLTELKKISNVLKSRQDEAEAWRRAITNLATIVDRDGITYYEITQSELGK